MSRVAAGGTGHLFGLSVARSSDVPAAAGLASDLGRVDVIDVYVGWVSEFPTATVARIRASGAVPMITWEPWNSQKGLHQSTFSLQKIAAGALDPYVERFARSAAAASSDGQPLLLRFAQEMNTDYYPWGVGVDGNTAGDFVAAWHHLHAVFSAVQTPGVKWVWAPNVPGKGASPLAAAYPGDGQVDLLGLDGYNAGTAVAGGSWRTPQQVLGTALQSLMRLAPDKRVLVTETGSTDSGGSKATWVRDLMQLAASDPQVVGVIWSEYVGRADWPLTADPSSERAMAAALRSDWAP